MIDFRILGGLEAESAQAGILLRQAHEAFQRIGAAETEDVLAELKGLDGSDPGGG